MTLDELKSVLSYNSESGVFTWKKSRGSAKAGDKTGRVGVHGYVQLKVFSRVMLAHRLAWFYVHGEWPSLQLDHIDGNPLNNAIANLRECSSAQNHQNRKAVAGSTSTHVGVCWDGGRACWHADIKTNGKSKYLGRFKDEQSAIDAYVKAKRLHHEFNQEVTR